MGGDFNAWKDLVIRAKGFRIQVGVFDGEVAEIAAIHEYGAPRAGIPERSYIRSTFSERHADLQAIMARVVRAMIAKQIDQARACALVGAWAMGAIKAQITTNGNFAPLKPATIRRKGSAKPLIDTAQLLNSITFQIVD